jgi:hypothetical protein
MNLSNTVVRVIVLAGPSAGGPGRLGSGLFGLRRQKPAGAHELVNPAVHLSDVVAWRGVERRQLLWREGGLLTAR